MREAALAQLAPQHRFGKRAAAAVGSAHHKYGDHGRLLMCVDPLIDGGATDRRLRWAYRLRRTDGYSGCYRASRSLKTTGHERTDQ
jgi:hypothetical protein